MFLKIVNFSFNVRVSVRRDNINVDLFFLSIFLNQFTGKIMPRLNNVWWSIALICRRPHLSLVDLLGGNKSFVDTLRLKNWKENLTREYDSFLSIFHSNECRSVFQSLVAVSFIFMKYSYISTYISGLRVRVYACS